MHRSTNSIDQSSRLRQFAWEQWDDQVIAVIFRPGEFGPERYVVKRYVEHALSRSARWRQLSGYFPSISPIVRKYALTSHEFDLMRRILDYHLNNMLHLRLTHANDHLIEYENLLDFISRAQELCTSNANSSNQSHSTNGKQPSISSIPSMLSTYVLSSSTNAIEASPPQSTAADTNPARPLPQSKKPQGSNTATNAHRISSSSNSSPRRSIPTTPLKPNLTSNQPSPPLPLDVSPNSLHNAPLDGSGWIQINNVFLPFIIKNRQRLVPYQVLVSCKILQPDELRSVLTHATVADVKLINSMIHSCKINNDPIPENALLINVRLVLVGTKDLIFIKLLPDDNPTSKINRHYQSVLVLRGGSVYIANRRVPFVCSSTHSYIPLNDIVSIYPYLHSQLKALARAPRTIELDYLQYIVMFYDERSLPSDTLLIDIEALKQTQVAPISDLTLLEYHAKEKNKLEQRILLSRNPSTNKRKNIESHENRQVQQRLKPSTYANQFRRFAPVNVHRPTGYLPPPPLPPPSSFNPQYHWLPGMHGRRGRTRWQ